MLFKTHIAIAIFAIILFSPLVNNPLSFAIVALIATALPDADSPFSKAGRSIPGKVVQSVTKHRGMLHSLTFCLIVAIILSVFMPSLAFGFFLGYSVHLIADSFTKMGITPFWPYEVDKASADKVSQRLNSHLAFVHQGVEFQGKHFFNCVESSAFQCVERAQV